MGPPVDSTWTVVAGSVTVGAALWTWARGRDRHEPLGTPQVAALVVTLVAGLWSWLCLRDGGPWGIVDSGRDLIQAVGIVHLGHWPAGGPHIEPAQSILGPAWYWVLAIPVWVGQPGAMRVAVACWRALTAGAMFRLVRRWSDTPTAAVAAAGLLLDGAVRENFSVLTHSNLLFLTVALAMDALMRLHVEGRSEQVVPLFFWLSLAVQFHMTAVVAVPVALAFALMRGRDARWPDVVVAMLAGLAPALPVLPALGGAEEPPWHQLWGVLTQSNGLVPVTVVALILARPRWFASWPGAAWTGVAALAWAAHTLPLPDGGRVSFLGLGTVPVGSSPTPSPATAEALPVWQGLLTFGGAPIDVGPPAVALAGVFLALGVWALSAQLRRPAADASRGRRAAGAALVLLALCITAPLGAVLIARAGPQARYASVTAMAVVVGISVGVVAWWRRVVAWSEAPGGPAPSRIMSAAAVVCYAAIPTALVGAMLAPLFALGLSPSRRRWAGSAWGAVVLAVALRAQLPPSAIGPLRGVGVAEALAPALRALPGMDAEGLMRRVHATPDLWNGHQSPTAPFLHLANLQSAGRPSAAPDRRHWRVFRPAAGEELRRAVELGGSGFVAVPFDPAVKVDEVVFERPLRQLGAPDLDRVSIPFRYEDEVRNPSWLTPRTGLAGRQLSPHDDGVVVDMRVPREVPADAALRSVEVVAVGGFMDGPPFAQTGCTVELQVDGVGQAVSQGSFGHWTATLPEAHGRVELRIVVFDCTVTVLDVFDVP